MGPQLKEAFQLELKLYKEAFKQENWTLAWKHVERAHILGQFFSLPHLLTHYLMLKLAWRTNDCFEVLAQVPRLILAVPGSVTGKAPLGNSGRSTIGIFTPAEIPEDLKSLLK